MYYSCYSNTRGVTTFQFLIIAAHLPKIFPIPVQHAPWKQTSFRVFHKVQSIAVVHKLISLHFLSCIHNFATDSKSWPTLIFSISDKISHANLDTQQPKNRWFTLSCSEQKRRVKSSRFFLLLRLSLVRILSFVSSHKNTKIHEF
jgi:hypothetical protein